MTTLTTAKFNLAVNDELLPLLSKKFIQSMDYRYPEQIVREALEYATADDFTAAKSRGFSDAMAVVVADFPIEEARLTKFRDAGLDDPKLWAVQPQYDVDKIIALSQIPGFRHASYIIPALEKGFTVEEAKKYGSTAVYYWTPEELSKVTVDAEAFEAMSQIFAGIKGRTERLTIAHVEALVNAGFTTKSEYWEYANALKLGPTLAAVEKAIKVRSLLSAKDLRFLAHFVGDSLTMSIIEDVSAMISLGCSLDDYVSILALSNREAEEDFKRRNSPSASVLRIVQDGLTMEQIAALTASGKALAEIA